MSDAVKYTKKLSGARILVIGGSSGIGFAVAEACVENGCTVIISSSQQTRIDSSISRLLKSYPSAKDRVTGHLCDLASSSSSEENIKVLFSNVGTVDHIVFTAGDKLATIPLKDATLESMQKAGMVRFFAPLLVAKYAPNHLSPGPNSSITLTTGSVSEKPLAGWSVPASYAGAMHSMMRNLALDLKPIRVNLVSPGLVETEMFDGMMNPEVFQQFKENHQRGMTTGRLGQPEDVAEAYLYCMRDRNVSGGLISTNGGGLLMTGTF